MVNRVSTSKPKFGNKKLHRLVQFVDFVVVLGIDVFQFPDERSLVVEPPAVLVDVVLEQLLDDVRVLVVSDFPEVNRAVLPPGDEEVLVVLALVDAQDGRLQVADLLLDQDPFLENVQKAVGPARDKEVFVHEHEAEKAHLEFFLRMHLRVALQPLEVEPRLRLELGVLVEGTLPVGPPPPPVQRVAPRSGLGLPELRVPLGRGQVEGLFLTVGDRVQASVHVFLLYVVQVALVL